MTSKVLAIPAVGLILGATFYSTPAEQPVTPNQRITPNVVVPEKIPNAVEEPKPIPADNHIGRYQVTGLDSSNTFVLVDTHTGQCWVKSPNQQWRDQGTPVK